MLSTCFLRPVACISGFCCRSVDHYNVYICIIRIIIYSQYMCGGVYIHFSEPASQGHVSILDPRFLRFCIFSAEPLSSQPFHFLSVARTSMSSPSCLWAANAETLFLRTAVYIYAIYIYTHMYACWNFPLHLLTVRTQTKKHSL